MAEPSETLSRSLGLALGLIRTRRGASCNYNNRNTADLIGKNRCRILLLAEKKRIRELARKLDHELRPIVERAILNMAATNEGERQEIK